jgi:glycosyltransferase involved in cell wall biosynthesis
LIFPGHVPDEDLRALYTGAIALAFPSLAEGFGRPPFEALACGTPALVADVEDTPDPMRAAAIPLPLEATAWADGIEQFIDEPELRAERVHSRTGALEGLSWDACTTQVLEACVDGVAASRPAHAVASFPAPAIRQ